MKNFSKIFGFVLAFVLSGTLFGCANPATKAENTNNAEPAIVVSEQNKQTSQDANMQVDGTDTTQLVTNSYIVTEWDAKSAPNGYLVYGEAIVEHEVAPGEYVYTGIDGLGRTCEAYACITTDDYQRELTEERESFKSDADKISGWGYNQKVSVTFPNDKTYNGYFYNRSHLIADSLGGSPVRENLVTGTRFQNVGSDNNGGMAYAETLARNWLAKAPNGSYIYYAVKPVYVEDELVPRSVFVDILSSDGTINEHIEVFNVSGDVDGACSVDYVTGKVIK